MQRKTIWTTVLFIGILLISTSSCKKRIDYEHLVEYHYLNNSDYPVKVAAFYIINDSLVKQNYNIATDGMFSQVIELTFGSRTDAFAHCDSLVLTFGDQRIASFTNKTVSAFNLLDVTNYVCTEINAYHKSYSYCITNKDFDNATDIVTPLDSQIDGQ